MKYQGGKNAIGKFIVDVMTAICPPAHALNGYLEPFCGSLGVFKNITDTGYKKYIASDKQPDLIEMWKKLQDGTLKIPKHISEEEYNKLKYAKSPNALKAVAGFGISFGGKYFAGYIQNSSNTYGHNYLREFKNSIEKVKPVINKSTVHFYNRDYTSFKPEHMLIYCDPPYKKTQGYSTGTFNHELFWETMRTWSKNNCVFISEESAPSDFKVIWRWKKFRSLSRTNKYYKEEKLYVHKDSYQRMKEALQKHSNIKNDHTKTRTHKKINKKTRKNKKNTLASVGFIFS
jgi:DNA adenine methylase